MAISLDEASKPGQHGPALSYSKGEPAVGNGARHVQAAIALLAATIILPAAPALAQTAACFSFSMDSSAQVFRFTVTEPGQMRVYQFGPPGQQPTSFIVPYAGPPQCTWTPQPNAYGPPSMYQPYMIPPQVYAPQVAPWGQGWTYPPRW